jgi:hypothetical protein
MRKEIIFLDGDKCFQGASVFVSIFDPLQRTIGPGFMGSLVYSVFKL